MTYALVAFAIVFATALAFGVAVLRAWSATWTRRAA